MRRYGVLIAVFLILASSSAVPQEGQPIQAGGFATFREFLSDQNIKLTKPSLIEALRNSDSHVRYFAALVLAEDKATDAIPAIVAALQSEKVPETRANIAFALAQLTEPVGLATLKSMCADDNVPAQIRIYATMYTLYLHDQSCLIPVLEIVLSTADSGTRALALSLLPRFNHVSGDDSRQIEDVTVFALKDKSSNVRIAASSTITRLATPTAIASLERAVAIEQDKAVKSEMQRDLQQLQNGQNP